MATELSSVFRRTLSYTVVFRELADGYTAEVPALPNCQAFGRSKEDARDLIASELEFHLAAYISAHGKPPNDLTCYDPEVYHEILEVKSPI